jgi:chromosome segregation ATPase
MKRQKIFITLMLLALLIAPNSSVYTQTRDSSIVTIDETVSFLLSQNEAAKNVIAASEKRIADLEAEIVIEQENSASIGKSYESAKTEIANLRSANESLREAVALNKNTIALLQTDNAKQKEKAKKATKDKWKAIAVAAGVIALKFLIP